MLPHRPNWIDPYETGVSRCVGGAKVRWYPHSWSSQSRYSTTHATERHNYRKSVNDVNGAHAQHPTVRLVSR